jgi:molybdenum cofactor cytidylyltransferase
MTIGAILLAAGSARRMGEDKLVAELGGKPLVMHAFDAILAARLEAPIVAVAPGSAVTPLIEAGATIVEVADHALGMAHSLSAAIRRVPISWTAAIICLADMPFVRSATVAALAREGAVNVVVRPRFEGRPGNPVLWGRQYFNRLQRLTGDQGGRAALADAMVKYLDCDDPGIEIDIDTPEALAEARARLERP